MIVNNRHPPTAQVYSFTRYTLHVCTLARGVVEPHGLLRVSRVHPVLRGMGRDQERRLAQGNARLEAARA